jgi:hypothetical protein
MAKAPATETEEKKDAIGAGYREKYGKTGHCGDDIASALKDYVTDEKGKIDQDKLWDVAKANGIDMNKYAHLNIGMQRMNLGNRLRGMHNKGLEVKIGKTKIAGAAQEEKKAA